MPTTKFAPSLGKSWGVTIPAKPGLDNIQMLEQIDKGNLKGMYIVGEDMAWVDADSNHTQEMLAKLDFLVVQEIFLSTTAQFADVILPGAPSLRKRRNLYQYGTPCTAFIPGFRVIQAIAKLTGGFFKRLPTEWALTGTTRDQVKYLLKWQA